MADNYTSVYSTKQQYKAQILVQVLADEGIEAHLLNQQDSMYVTIGSIEVMVHNNDVLKAKQIVIKFDLE